jgi:hypothetical protein
VIALTLNRYQSNNILVNYVNGDESIVVKRAQLSGLEDAAYVAPGSDIMGLPSAQNGHPYGHGDPPYGKHYEYTGQGNGTSLQQQQQQ